MNSVLKFTLAVIAVAVVTAMLTSAAKAGDQEAMMAGIVCGDTADIVAQIETPVGENYVRPIDGDTGEGYGEIRASFGVERSGGSYTGLWGNTVTGSWTLLRVFNDGRACMLASDDGGYALDGVDPDRGGTGS